jgi:hypothetical protein
MFSSLCCDTKRLEASLVKKNKATLNLVVHPFLIIFPRTKPIVRLKGFKFFYRLLFSYASGFQNLHFFLFKQTSCVMFHGWKYCSSRLVV